MFGCLYGCVVWEGIRWASSSWASACRGVRHL